jgi:type II secretory pathway pseudopilin PulG
VCVIIIGLLAAIGLPNFVGARKKAATSQLKSNMHTCQVAAESYATDCLGYYSSNTRGIQSYYPGGGMSPLGGAGNFPANPFTGSPDTVTTGSKVTNVLASRQSAAGTFSGASGNVEYDPIAKAGSNAIFVSYAVIGFDDSGKSVAGRSDKQLVLSNQ